MRRRRRPALALVLIAASMTVACASSTMTSTTMPVAKSPVRSAPDPVFVARGSFEGDGCFGEEVVRYLDAPGGLQSAFVVTAPIAAAM